MAETGQGTLAVDLDNTLAEQQVPFNPYSVGPPVLDILHKVRAEIAKGRHVICFTARAGSNDPGMWRTVRKWLDEQGLYGMRITNVKTPDISEIWDDRARQVLNGEVVKAASDHCTKNTCPNCGGVSTCRCSKPITNFTNELCPLCVVKKESSSPSAESDAGRGWLDDAAEEVRSWFRMPGKKQASDNRLVKLRLRRGECPDCGSLPTEAYKHAFGLDVTCSNSDCGRKWNQATMEDELRDKTKGVPCPKCESRDTFSKIMHEDTDMEESVKKCRACKHTWEPEATAKRASFKVKSLAPEDSDDRADVWSPADKTFYTMHVPDIHAHLAGREAEAVPIDAVWGGSETSPGFSEDRVVKADTNYPIVLDGYTEGEGFHGGLVDGRHRRIKLKRSGATHVNAIKLTPADIAALIAKARAAKQAASTESKQFQVALNKAVASGKVPHDMDFMVDDNGDTCIVNAGDWHDSDQIAASMELAREFFNNVIEENECGLHPGYSRVQPSSDAWRAGKKAASVVPTTGPSAIMHALKNIDLDAAEKQARAMIATGKVTKRDQGIKMLGIIDGMKRNELKPTDLMISKVPVLPPAFRPYGMMGNTYLPGVANELYGDLFKHIGLHRDTLNTLGEKGAVDSRRNMYDAVRALYGYGDPVSPKLHARGNVGYMKQITGPGSPKFSFAQRRMFSKTQDNVARGAITVAPHLDMNQIGIPREMAWDMLGSILQGRLARGGMSPMQAMDAVRTRSREATIALEQEVKERPFIYSRAPAWHQFNTIAGYGQLIDGDNIAISPYVTAGLNADFDGDTINLHVPVLPESVQEAKDKLLPDKMLFSIKNPDQVMAQPKHEQILGLFEPQRASAQNVHKFGSKQEALAAIRKGAVSYSDDIDFPD